MSDAVVRFEDVTYGVGNAALFQNLSLEVPAGSCTVVMGPSGGGKSTLLRLAAGLVVPNEGKVWFLDQDWNEVNEAENAALRTRLGFGFQNGALWANKSVYQNLELPFSYHRPKASVADLRAAVAQAARLAGVEEDLAHRPSQLSLGEQKLVSVARALVLDPEVLLFDDPTSGLDAQATEKLLQLFAELKRRGRTQLIVTQDPVVTARVADRLILVKGGRILDEGPFDRVVRNSDPEVTAILTTVLSQAATFSGDILDLLSIDPAGENPLK